MGGSITSFYRRTIAEKGKMLCTTIMCIGLIYKLVKF